MFDWIEVILPTFSLRTHDVEYFVFAVVAFFVWQNLKLSKRLKKLEEPQPLIDKKPSDYLLVRKGLYELPIPVGSEYIVPNEFPKELVSYVKHATLGDISKWLLEVGDMEMEKRHDIQRAITIGAMLNRNYIHHQLFRVDDRARVLWQRWKQDMTPLDPLNILQRLTIKREIRPTDWTKDDLDFLAAALRPVGVLIAKHSVHWNFVALSEFANKFRTQIKAPKTFLTDEVVMSIVTVYAIRAAVKIPTSYVSYDYLTVLILRAAEHKGTKPTPPHLKLVVSEQFEPATE